MRRWRRWHRIGGLLDEVQSRSRETGASLVCRVADHRHAWYGEFLACRDELRRL